MPTLPRAALALGFTLAALVALGPSCSSGGTGGAGGGSGGGNGAGGGGSTHPAVGFCNDYAAAICDFEIRCSTVSASARADCLASYPCDRIVASLVKGYQTFDATAGQQCVDTIKGAVCASFDQTLSMGCSAITGPNVGTGGNCLDPYDCKSSADSCGGPACSRSCQVAGAQGKPCPQNRYCDPGLRCEDATFTCQPSLASGATCLRSADCADTAYCDDVTSKCTALPTAGQPCHSPFGQCAPDAFCNSASTCIARAGQGASCNGVECLDSLTCKNGTCQQRVATGGSCSSFFDCQPGLRCLGGLCGPPKTIGQSCVEFNDCNADPTGSVSSATGDLICDDILKTCTAFDLSQKVGSTCTGNARDCEFGLTCKGAVRNPSGGVGTVGTCAVPKLGDSCTYQGDRACPEASFCNLAVDGGSGTCTASAIGSPCQSTECRSTDFCSNGLCEAKHASGELCTESDSCVSPLRCLPPPSGGATTCAKLGDVGAACANGSNSCLFPLLCTNGTCKHAGATGEQCLSYAQCLNGYCSPDAGTTCVPLLAANGDCQSGQQCSSGRCTNSKCEMTCQ